MSATYRDPDRLDRIPTKLYRLWKRQPDARFLQLIKDALENVYHVRPKEYFYTEDGEVEYALDEALRELGLDT